MQAFFLFLYRFFLSRKWLLLAFVVGLFAVFGVLASKISYEEDILRFVPSTASTKNVGVVFSHLKVKDKIAVIFSPEDSSGREHLVKVTDEFAAELEARLGQSHIEKITFDVGSDQATSFPEFVYSHLPLYLDTTDYQRIDTLLKPAAMQAQLENDAYQLMLPTGVFMKDFILRDPLGMGNRSLSCLEELRVDGSYQVIDGHLATADGRLLLFIAPRFPANNTVENGVLVDTLESMIGRYAVSYPSCTVDFYGGPVISVYNARQIRTDMMTTMGFALLVIAVVIFFAFKNKLSIIYIMLPVAFGAMFALAVLYFLRGNLSIIAVGAGSAILGVLLSYSIHVVAHYENCDSMEQLITEMWQPLTIGSFTTIGAFFSLTFTKSDVLQDFGWFASLSIVGATIFCLVFLPHLLPYGNGKFHSDGTPLLLRWVERFTSIDYSRKKILVGFIVVASVAGMVLCDRVTFSSDMNALGYQPAKFDRAQQLLDSTFQRDGKSVYFIAVAENADDAIAGYRKMSNTLDSLQLSGNIRTYSSARSLLLDSATQARRLSLWSSFWTKERIALVCKELEAKGKNYGFTAEAFAPFRQLLAEDYHIVDFSKEEVLGDFLTSEEDLSMAIAQVSLTEGQKADAYAAFENRSEVVILDKPHFMSQFVDATTDDFNFVLLVSSLIVFIALLVSYGRFELALMSFLPMALSWFIILGVMALLGLQFNIVSVIISTFIFGTGDDFSIFITDGLLSEYRTGKTMLTEHKTAIAFSAFTTVVGMGALFFAKHPSLLSVAQTSVIGMVAVVLIAYTIQPLLWRFFVTSRTSRGKAPWTLARVFTMFPLVLFAFLSLLLVLLTPLFYILPFKKKFHWFRLLVMWGCRLVLACRINKCEYRNESGFNFERPVMVIANHQSIVDMLQLMAYTTKLVPIVKAGVKSNFLIGPINYFYQSCSTSEGYENMVEPLRQRVRDGYSILVFPEGHRCDEKQQLGHFYDGAFYLAEKLDLDILPIIMLGNGCCVAKGDMFFVCPTDCVFTVMPVIRKDDASWGATYRERRKSIHKWFKAEYDRRMACFVNTGNRYYVNHLFQNYIYKGPVTEWYMRVKVRLENNYKLFNEMVPRKAVVTDIGCGYGFLDYMLMFMSKDRVVKGIDYDDEKVAVANHCFSKNERIDFLSCNAFDVDLPNSDVFILNDMLHYMPYEKQQQLIERCMGRLLPDGSIIIRDGNTSNEEGQKVTKWTEILSTKIFRFNKTEGQLFFTSFERISSIAEQNGFRIVEHMANDDTTSNEIYVLKKVALG